MFWCVYKIHSKLKIPSVPPLNDCLEINVKKQSKPVKNIPISLRELRSYVRKSNGIAPLSVL